MQKTRLLVAAAVLCVNFICGQLYYLVCQKSPLKQHFYAFQKCDPVGKPGHRMLYRSSTRSQTLKVSNYSLMQLFSLAAGEGRLIPYKYTLNKSLRPEQLRVKYCYEISIATKDAAYLYRMMMISLRRKFPQYEIVLKNQGQQQSVLITDKQQ